MTHRSSSEVLSWFNGGSWIDSKSVVVSTFVKESLWWGIMSFGMPLANVVNEMIDTHPNNTAIRETMTRE